MALAFTRAVVNPEGVRGFFAKLGSRRADVLICGDSNMDQASNSIGHAGEITNKYAEIFGLYATSLNPAYNSSEASTSGATGAFTGFNAYTPATYYPSAPAEFLDVIFSNLSSNYALPRHGVWVPSGTPFGPATNSEILFVYNRVNFDRYASLKFHNWLWVPDTADRTFYPTVLGSGGVATVRYPTGNAVPLTVSGGVGVRRLTWDIPDGLLVDFSDPGNSAAYGVKNGTVVEGVGFRTQHWSGVGAADVSNYGSMYWTCENTEQVKGSRVSVFYQKAGMSAYNMAIALMDASDNAIRNYLQRIAELQVDENGNQLDPVILLQMTWGRNCASVTSASVVHNYGDARNTYTTGANSNTADGTKNNYQSILNRVAYQWAQLGYSTKNIYLLVTSHVGESGDTARYAYYRTTQPTAFQNLLADTQNARLGGMAYIDSGQLLLTPEMRYGQLEQENAKQGDPAGNTCWTPSANLARRVNGFEDGAVYDPGQAHLRRWAYEMYWARHMQALGNALGGWSTVAAPTLSGGGIFGRVSKSARKRR